MLSPSPDGTSIPDRLRKHLWHSSEALQANILRNSIEFAADGNDPKRVREEDGHILYPATGNLIRSMDFELA